MENNTGISVNLLIYFLPARSVRKYRQGVTSKEFHSTWIILSYAYY